jgi:hypothetical protein
MSLIERSLPEDPLAFIRERVRRRRIFWTYHVNMRLAERFIRRVAILEAVDRYEIVESYPYDKYLPSYLILARTDDDAFHALFAVDLEGDNVRVVTAYRPSPSEWKADLKTRRVRR